MSSTYPFTSQELRIGEPPLRWDYFERPRLRQFSEPKENLGLGKCLGHGADGVVFKARIASRMKPLAVKIFHFNRRPQPIRYCLSDNPGTERHWAFERECINRAILDMIAASLRRAAAADRQIYIHPQPKTRSQALDNLWAFSDEAMARPPAKDFVPFSSEVLVTDCLGWTAYKRSDVNEQFRKAGVSDQESRIEEEIYPAIVYELVDKEGIPDLGTIVSQLNFLHSTGFVSVSFNEKNWLGKGILVDFSDIVSYHAGKWWDASYYATEQQEFRRIVQRAADNGLLGPPPKPINRPRRLPAHFGSYGSGHKQTPRNPLPLPPPPPQLEQGPKMGLP